MPTDFCRNAILCVCALVLNACASAQSASSFPSRQALAELKATPPPSAEKIFGQRSPEVESWTLTGPLPTTLGIVPHAASSAWDNLLAQAAERKPGTVMASEGMHCVAREVGQFVLAKGALPGLGLETFIEGRCATLGANVELTYMSSEVSAEIDDDTVLANWRDSVNKMLAQKLGAGMRLAGVWFGRQVNRAVVVLASGQRRVHVEPVSLSPVDGKITLRGELFFDADSITAKINRGTFGYRDCRAAANVRPPQFVLECEVDPDDAHAWVEALGVPPGRVLGSFFLRFLALRQGEELATYSAPQLGEPVLAESAAAAAVGLGTIVNRAREQAGLAPLEVSVAQSRVAAEVAPYYFAALLGQAPATVADKAVLGLQAGWEVSGLIQSGGFTSAWELGSRDLNHVFAAAIAHPYGRAALLDPELQRLAVGAVPMAKMEGLAAVFCSYRLFIGTEPGELAQKVLESLTQARAARGASAPRLISGLGSIAAQAAEAMSKDGLAPERALDRFMRASVAQMRVGVRSWTLRTNTLENMEFPEELLTSPSLAVALAVAVVKPADQPWGQYVVLLIFPAATGQDA